MKPAPADKFISRDLLDVLIRAGLIGVLVMFCYQVFQPFLNLMLWSMILAITLYPLHGKLRHAWVTTMVAPLPRWWCSASPSYWYRCICSAPPWPSRSKTQSP